jgi:N utilization substance protein A
MSTSLLKARTEFAAALNQICAERGISPDSVIETIKSAILAAYRKDFGLEEGYHYEVELNQETGGAKVYRYPLDEEAEDEEAEDDEEVEFNEDEKEEITPPGFGRIAAQTAKQVILQKVREAEKDAIIEEFRDKVGTMINGMVLRFEGRDVICDIGRGQGRMPPQEQVHQENYRLNKRLALYIKGIEETPGGEEIIVSRAAPELVKKLFYREVPEVSSGAVEIIKVAREAGSRSKVAVVSTRSGVDPVGSCVGQKGVRVQAVIEQLGGEKIDIIPYNKDPVMFITAALSPADNLDVELDQEEETAVVKVPADQLSLAIGRDGQNVRLASKLTGYKIDIEEKEGTAVEDEEEAEKGTEGETEEKATDTEKKEAAEKPQEEEKKNDEENEDKEDKDKDSKEEDKEEKTAEEEKKEAKDSDESKEEEQKEKETSKK